MTARRWLQPRWLAGFAFALAGLIFASLLNSCSSVDPLAATPPQIAGATFVGDRICADCHANITRAFPASAHARLHLDQPATAVRHGCESCHGPASLHVAQGGRGGLEKFIVNPGKNPAACFQCHLDVQAQFHFPQHHPVLEGKMNCVQCHDPHGEDIMKPARGLAMSRMNESCAQCHREQTRPMVFEHPALREGCAACHDPHGSPNAKMLALADSNLCLRCHAQVRAAGNIYIGNISHTGFLRFGSCWTAGCHVAVHGSNTQPYLLY